MLLDEIDIKILNILQDEGRTKRNVLAEAVKLSLPSLSERLNKLEEKGIITGYYTKLNLKNFGLDLMAFITIHTDSSKHYDSFAENVKNTEEILECYAVLGEGSHIMKAIVKDSLSLEKLLSKIQSWKGVKRTHSRFVLSTIKETTKIKIKAKEQ
ncbi:MAG: Lrp/AsnC family transcriptional regulator [Bacteroidetes bacterium]|nr:Lrp/AsnC family transcriptional regulator [Bacteroidota bacterium]MBU1116778.1 Lrp/AsnC family transcriptional regulator [Bacteroidota bacterium]MBU1798383.1 Lrp/AsnC family transcriptional regulator [Bacteroidota bacterium]